MKRTAIMSTPLYGEALLRSLTGDQERTNESIDAREGRIARAEVEDTDCFVSSWAGGLTQRLQSTQVEILQNGGVADFPALLNPDGSDSGAVLLECKTRFGTKWTWKTLDGRWVTDGPRAIPKAGFLRGTVKRPAWAKLGGGGRGLAGACSVSVCVFPARWNRWTGEGLRTEHGAFGDDD
jgi:hypothetical protein